MYLRCSLIYEIDAKFNTCGIEGVPSVGQTLETIVWWIAKQKRKAIRFIGVGGNERTNYQSPYYWCSMHSY